MKYLVDFESNHGFLQIFGVTEYGDQMAGPLAFQVRGGAQLLESLSDAVGECLARIKAIDEGFHNDQACRQAFEDSFVIHAAGQTPVTLVTQARRTTLIIGARQVGNGALFNLDAFQKALKKALARLEKIDHEVQSETRKRAAKDGRP